MLYKEYSKHYLIDTKENILLESDSRKKLRRLARSKYPKEYPKAYSIVSGNSLKNAIENLKRKTTSNPKDKAKSLSTKTIGKKIKPNSKTARKTNPKNKKHKTLLEDVIASEDKENARINRKNLKSSSKTK